MKNPAKRAASWPDCFANGAGGFQPASVVCPGDGAGGRTRPTLRFPAGLAAARPLFDGAGGFVFSADRIFEPGGHGALSLRRRSAAVFAAGMRRGHGGLFFPPAPAALSSVCSFLADDIQIFPALLLAFPFCRKKIFPNCKIPLFFWAKMGYNRCN